MADSVILVIGSVLVGIVSAWAAIVVANKSKAAAEMTVERQAQLQVLAVLQAQLGQQDARITLLTSRLEAAEEALHKERQARWALEEQLRQGGAQLPPSN